MTRTNSILQYATALPLALLLGACSDNADTPPNAAPLYDFSAIDARMQAFVDGNERFDGLSYTLVDIDQGTVHEAALGDNTLDTVVYLASTSKVPSVTLLMALNDDPDLDFDVAASIDRYLPWEGVYGDRTVTQLVSNTAGIPGLGSIGEYGPHICQYLAIGTLESCAQIIYTNELENSSAPGTGFDYGGSQWQLAGAIAEQVTNSTWNQAFDAYIGEPCDLEVFTYGNMWTDIDTWTGHPDSLFGQDNPSIEGGAITNMRDYAKLLLLHLRDGRCGEQQVVSPESLAYMRENRGAEFGTNYGMGWWIIPGDNGAATVYDDPGAYGSISWIDLERGIGGYVGVDTYSPGFDNQVPAFVRSEIIALHQALVDEARAAAN